MNATPCPALPCCSAIANRTVVRGSSRYMRCPSPGSRWPAVRASRAVDRAMSASERDSRPARSSAPAMITMQAMPAPAWASPIARMPAATAASGAWRLPVAAILAVAALGAPAPWSEMAIRMASMRRRSPSSGLCPPSSSPTTSAYVPCCISETRSWPRTMIRLPSAFVIALRQLSTTPPK